MDYLEIIKLLQQFDKMKKISFDTDQINIFEHFFKPRIMEKDNINEKQIYNRELITEDEERKIDYNLLYESYKEIQSKDEKTDIDDRIMELFDNDLKLPFKIMHMNEID